MGFTPASSVSSSSFGGIAGHGPVVENGCAINTLTMKLSIKPSCSAISPNIHPYVNGIVILYRCGVIVRVFANL
jgi:hypothetical protein